MPSIPYPVDFPPRGPDGRVEAPSVPYPVDLAAKRTGFRKGAWHQMEAAVYPRSVHAQGNAKLGMRGLRDCKERDTKSRQTYDQGRMYVCSANCTRTVHSPFGETSRIASGSASFSHPQHEILHPRFIN